MALHLGGIDFTTDVYTKPEVDRLVAGAVDGRLEKQDPEGSGSIEWSVDSASERLLSVSGSFRSSGYVVIGELGDGEHVFLYPSGVLFHRPSEGPSVAYCLPNSAARQVGALPLATEQYVDERTSSVYRFKGSVPTYNDLPRTGNEPGDVWDTQDTGDNYAYVGETSNDEPIWDQLGPSMAGYQKKLTPGQGISIDAAANISIPDGGVTNSMLATNAVNGAKIANLSVSTGKLTNGAVSTAKIADGAVTADKISSAVLDGLATKDELNGKLAKDNPAGTGRGTIDWNGDGKLSLDNAELTVANGVQAGVQLRVLEIGGSNFTQVEHKVIKVVENGLTILTIPTGTNGVIALRADIGDATLTVQTNGANPQTFKSNASQDKTINIVEADPVFTTWKTDNPVVLGNVNVGTAKPSGGVIIGSGAKVGNVNQSNAIAIGNAAYANNSSAIAIGSTITVSGLGSAQLGHSDTALSAEKTFRFRDTVVVNGNGKIPSENLDKSFVDKTGDESLTGNFATSGFIKGRSAIGTEEIIAGDTMAPEPDSFVVISKDGVIVPMNGTTSTPVAIPGGKQASDPTNTLPVLATTDQISSAITAALQDLARNGIVVDGRRYRLVPDAPENLTQLAQSAGVQSVSDNTRMGDIETALSLNDSNTVQDAINAVS